MLIAVILGSSYCSGFVDSSGRWNSGFYCPETEELISVFCCGSSTDKYCCTKVTQIIFSSPQILQHSTLKYFLSAVHWNVFIAGGSKDCRWWREVSRTDVAPEKNILILKIISGCPTRWRWCWCRCSSSCWWSPASLSSSAPACMDNGGEDPGSF